MITMMFEAPTNGRFRIFTHSQLAQAFEAKLRAQSLINRKGF